MHYVSAALVYVLWGLPVWAWLLASALLGAQEAINRSKKLKAQTYAQVVGNVFALAEKTILGRFPIVGQAISILASLKTPDSSTPPTLSLVPADKKETP